MSQVVTVKIRGLDELQRKLEQMPRRAATKIIRNATNAGAKVFQEEMIRRAPRGPARVGAGIGFIVGWLAQHIIIRLRVKSDELSAQAAVGPQKIDYPARRSRKGGTRRIGVASVARFLEFGTKRMRAHPFIRQAFESTKQAALDAFLAQAKKAFDEEAH